MNNQKSTSEISVSETPKTLLSETPAGPPLKNSKTIRRNIRDSLTDIFASLARVSFFWLPGGDVAAGRALMVCHPIFIGASIALFFIAPSKSPLRIILAILSIFVSASQWLFSGCVVTRAEQRLTGSKETILDPFLLLAGIEPTRETRIAGTIAAGTSISVILIWSVLCEFFFH